MVLRVLKSRCDTATCIHMLSCSHSMMKKDPNTMCNSTMFTSFHIQISNTCKLYHSLLQKSSESNGFPIRSSSKRGEENPSQAAVSQSLGCTYPWNGPGHVSNSNHDLILPYQGICDEPCACSTCYIAASFCPSCQEALELSKVWRRNLQYRFEQNQIPTSSTGYVI